MNVTLSPVSRGEKEILRNLLEKYCYEFSQWDGRQVNELGLFGYDWLDCYWTEEGRWAYFIRVDERLAGFAMVNDYQEIPGQEIDFCLAEFFVMYPYCRSGVGSMAARSVFDLHRGRWMLKRHPHNLASVAFWDRVVSEYTSGQYTCVCGWPDHAVDYDDGTPADVLFFDNKENG